MTLTHITYTTQSENRDSENEEREYCFLKIEATTVVVSWGCGGFKNYFPGL